MQVLKIAGASILALGLILGLALPGLAAPEVALPWADDFQARIVKGEVLEVREADREFDIQSGEEELPISVNSDTKYYKLCVPGRIVSLARHWMQFRHQNQEEIGAPGWGGMGLGLQNQVRARALAQHQIRLQNQEEIGAPGWGGTGLGLQNRVRVRASVRNQIRLQNQISQPENVPLSEPQQAKLKWFCPFGEEAEFSDIEKYDRVVVWLADGENSDYLAERVLIIKPTTYASVSGTITDISSSAIEITPDDGDPVPLSYNESTVFILNGFIAVDEGQYACAIYDSQNMLAERVTVSLTGD